MPNFVPSGTKMLFYQAAAPTGWTIDSTLNDVGVKIVNANGGTIGGSTAFSSIFGKAVNTSSTTVSISGTTGATTLTVAMLASHNHTTSTGTSQRDIAEPESRFIFERPYSYGGNQSVSSTGSNGTHNHSFSGSSSHTHNITLNLKYINVIVCSKD